MLGIVRSEFNLISWFWAIRPFSLGASIVPVVVGTSAALNIIKINWTLFILTLLGSILIQIGTNLTDEYKDHQVAEQVSKYPAPHKVIARGLLSENAVAVGIILAFGLATVIGLYIVSQTGWVILAIGFTGIAIAYFYSAGPYPIGNLGLGEIIVFLAMGPTMVLAAFFVQTGTFTWPVLLISLPVGLTVTAIMHCNNLRDINEDTIQHKRTIAVFLGWEQGRYFYAALLIGNYVLISLFAILEILPVFTLFGLITIPLAFQTAKGIWSAKERSVMNQSMIRTALLHLYTGLIISFGISFEQIF